MVPGAAYVSPDDRSDVGVVRRRATSLLVALVFVTAVLLGWSGGAMARGGASSVGASGTAVRGTGENSGDASETREMLEARVRSVLERGCLGCHGAAGPAPVGGLLLARPIDLGAIVADRGLVQPANPDASPLYTVPLLGHLPHDRLGRGDDGSGLDAEDMAALRRWISDSPAAPPSQCRARRGAEERALLAAARAAEDVPEEHRQHRRYVSLAALDDGCSTAADLEAYRKVLQWALFSTARSGERLVSRFVGQDRAVLELDLAALAWTEADWLHLADGGAVALRTDPAVTAYLQSVTGSARPYTDADRVAARLLDPDVYRQLLQAPSTLAVLLSSARVDVAAPADAATTARVLLPASPHTTGPRLLERRSTLRGPLWLAWSVNDPEARSKLDTSPTLAIGEDGMRVDGARVILNRPNGLPAFLDTTGEAPLGAEARGGLRCLTCHALGPAAVATAKSKATLTAPVAGPVPAIEAEERRALAAFIEEARSTGRMATARLGLADVENLTVDGLPALLALARRHRDRVGLEAAADEVGLSATALSERLRGRGGEADGTLALLAQGSAHRAHLVRKLSSVGGVAPVTVPARSAAAASVSHTRPGSGPVPGSVTTPDSSVRAGVELWARLDKSYYRTGDLVTLMLGADRDCHIVVLNVESSGRTTVLLPNDFEATVFLPAGRTLQLPSPSSAFQLRAGVPGRERLIVLCNGVAAGADGIAHDFEKQKFTDLGDFSALLEQVWNAEPLTVTSAIVAARAARTRAAPRRGRRRAARSRPSIPPPPVTAPILAPLAWTGVVVEIAPRDTQ